MSNAKSHENYFYTYNMARLIESTKRRKELESSFDKSKRFAYDEICENQISYAIELLKMGVDSELKDGKVSILADNGEIIDFSQEEILDKVGDNVFSIMFPKEKIAEPVEDDDLESFDEEPKIENKTTDYWEKDNILNPQEVYPNYLNDMQRNMFMNPMALFLPMMTQTMQMMQASSMQPKQRPMGYKRYNNSGDPLQAVQLQLEELKTSRDKMKEKAIYYKKEYQEYKTKYEEAEKENEELDKVAIEQINELKNEKQILSEEITCLKEDIGNKESVLLKYKDSINNLKSDLSNNERATEEYKETVQNDLSNLQNSLNSCKNTISQYEQEIEGKIFELNQKNREISEKEKELADRSSQLINTEQLLKISQEKIEVYDKKEKRLSEQVKSLEVANEELKRKLKDSYEKFDLVNEKNEELNQQISNISSSQDSDKKKYESLKNENNLLKNREKELQNEINLLKSKNSEMDKKYSELDKRYSEQDISSNQSRQQIEKQIEEIKNLKEELSILREVAYKDSTFEINSWAGFNKFYNDKKNHIQFVALIDVCSMKDINTEFGEEIGNNVIRFTIEELVNSFGKDNVYRIRGAQFGIVVKNGSYSKVQTTLANIKKTLNEEKEFDIVYGLVSISKCNSRNEALIKARSEMQHMKEQRDAMVNSGSRVQDNSYVSQTPMDNLANTANYQYPLNDNPMLQNQTEQEPVQGNPNVAVDMLADDTYGDVATAKEIDATSIDLAKEIMEMANL